MSAQEDDMSDKNKLTLDPALNFAACNEAGRWWAYESEPKPKLSEWQTPFGDYRTESLSAFVNLPPSTYWRNSLHQIIDGVLVPCNSIPSCSIPAKMAKVIVWREDGGQEENRYSAGKLNGMGHLYCYIDGGTKWLSNERISAWPHWREVK